jgi:hypothetical protein
MLAKRIIAATALVAIIGGAASVAAAHKGGAAAPRPFTGKLTYRETDPGKDHGARITAIAGKGTFSGTLTGRALMAATLVQLVKGVPVTAMAKGGTWSARYDIDAKNSYSGIVVAKFRSPGLGSVCLSGKVAHGKFTSGFIPASGTLRAIGGTGTAAGLRLSAKFTQTSITGSDVESFLGNGSFAKLSMGAAKPMSAACKAVAKL